MEGKEEPKKGKPEEKKPGITKGIGIKELVENYPESIAVLMQKGFHCLGCVAAQFETLEQGAKAHGIDVNELVKGIKKAVEEGKKENKEK